MFSMWYKGGCKEISFELATEVALAPKRAGRRLSDRAALGLHIFFT